MFEVLTHEGETLCFKVAFASPPFPPSSSSSRPLTLLFTYCNGPGRESGACNHLTLDSLSAPLYRFPLEVFDW